jgi:toluene monooxygenase system ferredoxin subunit
MNKIPVLQWTMVASCDDLWEGEMLPVTVNGEEVLLVYGFGKQLRAYQSRCPHQRIPLLEGEFDGKTIICRAHLWQFDAASGKGINPENCQLTTYAVKIEKDLIYIGLPQD